MITKSLRITTMKTIVTFTLFLNFYGAIAFRRHRRQHRIESAGFPKLKPPDIPGYEDFASPDECQRIHVNLCKNIGYNMTKMPNQFGHNSQREAEMTLGSFQPLIQYGCHRNLTFFLCTVYFPMCDPSVAYPIGECFVTFSVSFKPNPGPDFGFEFKFSITFTSYHVVLKSISCTKDIASQPDLCKPLNFQNAKLELEN